MGAGAGAVGNVDRVGEPAQRGGLAQQVLRVEGHRRGDLGGHDKAAGPQPLGEGAGEGAKSVVHRQARSLPRRKKSAYMFCRFTAIARFGGAFSGQARPRPLKHDPEKWDPIFGKDHAQTKG